MIIKRNEKGRGVYATRSYVKGDIVEVANVFLVPEDEVDDDDIVAFYVFCWEPGVYAIAISNASLFNHSPDPNVEYSLDKENVQLVFKAKKDIEAGGEILLDYGYDDFMSEKKAKFARGDR